MNKGKREGIGGTNCQDNELPLQTILQVHAQSTCKNASNKEHIEFWCMRLSKNCWLVENADATCTIKGALDSNRVVKKILRASLSYKEGSSMLFFNAEIRATSIQNNPCVFQSWQFVLTALLQQKLSSYDQGSKSLLYIIRKNSWILRNLTVHAQYWVVFKMAACTVRIFKRQL